MSKEMSLEMSATTDLSVVSKLVQDSIQNFCSTDSNFSKVKTNFSFFEDETVWSGAKRDSYIQEYQEILKEIDNILNSFPAIATVINTIEKELVSADKKTISDKTFNSVSGILKDAGINIQGYTIYDGYRTTFYYPAETTNKTASGKTTADFKIETINGKNVYTYQGKIVVATATNSLLKTWQKQGKSTILDGYFKDVNVRQEGKHYFDYGDTFILTIGGKDYEAIVLDCCGASMGRGEYRIDIFVPTAKDNFNYSDVSIKIPIE